MCQKRTDSQKPLSGAWAKVQGHATAQLQLSNQSPVMCQLGISAMTTSIRSLNDDKTLIAMMPPDKCRQHRFGYRLSGVARRLSRRRRDWCVPTQLHQQNNPVL